MSVSPLEPYELLLREIVRSTCVIDGRITEAAFLDLFAANANDPGGSSCTREALNNSPSPTPPRDAYARGRVGDLPGGFTFVDQSWEVFAACVVDAQRGPEHAEVRARPTSAAPALDAHRPSPDNKAARQLRKNMRMAVAATFHPV